MTECTGLLLQEIETTANVTTDMVCLKILALGLLPVIF